jgi:hypothetical protein
LSAAKHTPGPWSLGIRLITADTSDTFNVAVALISTAREAPELSEDERKANARLIAAAPEMYELLKRFAELTCDEETPDAGDVLEARALVDRVEGHR